MSTLTIHKSILLIFFAFFAFALFSHAPLAHAGITVKSTASPSLNAGLVGYWNFDEGAGSTAYDKSGQGNTGTLTNMALNAWVNGNTGLGTALSFDGVNDYVDVGNSSSIKPSSAITLSIWAYSTGNDVVNGQVLVSATKVLGTSDAYQIYYDITNKIRFGVDTTYLTTTNTLALNVWTHIVCTWDGATMAIYFNGVLQNTASKSGTITYSTDNVRIGGNVTSKVITPALYFFKGSLDDVRIFNRALSQTEITRLYKLKKTALQGADQTGMVGWWKFDEGQGTNAGDSSGKGNNGVLTAMSSPPTATSGWGKGKNDKGTGLNFDGVDDYVDVANSTSNNINTALTLSVWFKAPVGGNSTGNHWRMIQKNTDQYSLFFLVGSTLAWGDNSGYKASVATYTDGKWHHFVGIHDGSNTFGGLSLYVDGVLLTNTTTPGSFNGWTQNSTSLIIGGAQPPSINTYFNGSLDDVRIYNRALSPAEITKIYKEKAGVKIGVAPNNGSVATGLVGYWPFDGKTTGATYTTDVSGSGNTGILTNGPVPTIGKLGQALKFDGVNDYVAIPYSPTIAPTNITLSYWVFENATPTAFDTPVARKYDSTGIPYFSDFRGAGNQKVSFGTYTGGADASYVIANTSLTVGQWYHVVGMFDGTSYRIYINGILDNTLVDSTALYGGTNLPLNIGMFDNNGTPSRFFNGKMDDVRIYNRALSAAEIKRLYNGGRTGN